MLGLGKLVRTILWIARHRKYLTMIAMAVCLGLAWGAVDNVAVDSWTSIGVVFLANECFLPVTLVSMIPSLPRSTKLLCSLLGGVLFFYANIQVSEAWAIKYDLLTRIPYAATTMHVEGVRQLYLVAAMCQLIACSFALDFFYTCFMAQPKPEPQSQPNFHRRPLDTVSYSRIQQLRDFKR